MPLVARVAYAQLGAPLGREAGGARAERLVQRVPAQQQRVQLVEVFVVP